jgi:hypothetical protein
MSAMPNPSNQLVRNSMMRFLVTFLTFLLMTSEVNAQTDKNAAAKVVRNISMTIVASSGRPVNQNEFITLASNDEETSWQYFNSSGIMTAEGNVEITAQRLSSALENVFSLNNAKQLTLSEREEPLFFFSMLYFVDGKPACQPTMSDEILEQLVQDDTFGLLFSSIKKQVFGKAPAMPKLWQRSVNKGDVTTQDSRGAIESTLPPTSFVTPPPNKKIEPPRSGKNKNRQ